MPEIVSRAVRKAPRAVASACQTVECLFRMGAVRPKLLGIPTERPIGSHVAAEVAESVEATRQLLAPFPALVMPVTSVKLPAPKAAST